MRSLLVSVSVSLFMNVLAVILYLSMPPIRWPWWLLSVFLTPGERLVEILIGDLHGLGFGAREK